MSATTFGDADAQLLFKHLEAQIGVEFFTIPLYLTAVYSFTNAATGYKKNGDYPLFTLQQKVLSVAVQEMYHLQEACNLANAFSVTPAIPAAARSFPAGAELTVPHLAPGHKLTVSLGNLPHVITPMIDVEKPDLGTPPPPNANVVYPSIGDLYHATLTLLGLYLDAFATVPIAHDPYFTHAQRQVVYNTFGTRYQYNAVDNKDDAKHAANAITDQGEGREVVPEGSAHFASGVDCDVLAPYQAAAGSRFAAYDTETHFCRFEDVKKALDTTWSTGTVDGKPIFYVPNGQNQELPEWAASIGLDTFQQALNATWSYLVDIMVAGFVDGGLSPNYPDAAGDFGTVMTSLKYLVPLIWQHGVCPSFEYRSGVDVKDVQDLVDQADPLCLFHWDTATQAVRANPAFTKNACQGLNQCAGQGWGGIATDAGTGACATADFHTCQGGNTCSHQGGCGFLSKDANQQLLPPSEQWIPAHNQGATTGGCQSPISTGQVFASNAPIPSGSQWDDVRALRGSNVWDHARSLMGANPPELQRKTQNGIDYDGTARRKAVPATSKT